MHRLHHFRFFFFGWIGMRRVSTFIYTNIYEYFSKCALFIVDNFVCIFNVRARFHQKFVHSKRRQWCFVYWLANALLQMKNKHEMCNVWYPLQQQRFLLTSIVTVDGAGGAACVLIPSDSKRMSRASPNTAAYHFTILHRLWMFGVQCARMPLTKSGELNLNDDEFAFPFSYFQRVDCAVRSTKKISQHISQSIP